MSGDTPDLAVFDELAAANAAYVRGGGHHPVPVRPSRRLTVLTCMDARIDVFAVLGLELGQAHVVRNAGARVTADVLRSLTLSTALLGTRFLAQIAHTDCGAHDPEDATEARLTEALGRPPEQRRWHTFADPTQALHDDAEQLRRWTERPPGFAMASYVFDVTTGALAPVVAPHVVPGP